MNYTCRRGSPSKWEGTSAGGSPPLSVTENIPFEVCFCLLRRRIDPWYSKREG